MPDQLAAIVADLVDRVALLESAGSRTRLGPRSVPPSVDVAATGGSGDLSGNGRVGYSGTGPWEGSSVAWRTERGWDDVIALAADPVARVLTALANDIRLRIVGELVSGPAGTGELAARLQVATSGQLFHHLKELLGAGVIHQPRRGVYALRPQHVLPLLAVISAAGDIASSTDEEPS